ncbi:DUF2924 domain-containing protein [Chelatococcus sambhunathii]|uniref:DUF2924 domain-containing protein n=1 Tax=Chelatococcus sambhunathii TaxID=363953 RepID=A0ABU1DCD9_9HYPH|nr:hypothetical protein [Chelatococcus sambhunathii]MDR4305736.1 DUF2924 domain-containing protein [Chelatococcus sambhunathii]
MPDISVDFEVWKAITLRRETEAMTPNDVLRQILDLPPEREPTASEFIGKFVGAASYKGVFFNDGTQFRAIYKGKEYRAAIVDGVWTMEDGTQCTSPSNAATHITKTNVNGWRFWQVKRPEDADWKLMDLLLP